MFKPLATDFLLFVCVAEMACAARAATPNFGSVHSFARLTSDYRVNGVSSSDRRPAAQASVYWAAPQRFFAGAWMSTVDFNDPGHTSYELDFYVGRTFKLEHVDVVPELFFYTTPDRTGPGPRYDYTEARLRLQDQLGPLTLRCTIGWSPEYSYGAGKVWRLETASMYSISPRLMLHAVAGRRWLENRVDRSHWEAGLELKWRRLSFDVRYVNTNLTRQQCGSTDWCDAELIGSVTYTFPSLP